MRSRSENKEPVAVNDKPLALIEYNNITVIQNMRRVLHNITLSISPGEHVAIIGPNGAGKSFLIKTITRECYPLPEPDSLLSILGKTVWNVAELRSLLGIVNGELVNAFSKDCTGKEAVISGFFSSTGIWQHHRITPAMERKARETMELLEITHLAKRRMNAISTGEVRRILIGRALVHNPKALILDEPSSGLDFRASSELRKIMSKLGRTTAIILVTHNLTDIIPEINRVVFLKDGEIFADGSKEKLITSERLSQLYGIPLEVARRDGYYYLW